MVFLREEYPEMSLEEEKVFYNDNLEYVITHVRYVLEHLDDGTFWVYKTNFENYE